MADTIQESIHHRFFNNDTFKIPFVRYVVSGVPESPHSHDDGDRSLSGCFKSIVLSESGIFKHLRVGLIGFTMGLVGGLYLRGRTFNQFKWVRDILEYQFDKPQTRWPIVLLPACWTGGIFMSFSIWMGEIYDMFLQDHSMGKHRWSFNKVNWAALYLAIGASLIHPSLGPWMGAASWMTMVLYWLLMNYHLMRFPINEAGYVQLPIS